jgi:allantoicase
VPADFRSWPELARRDVGGAVIWTNDELFAAADNLINPGPSVHDRDSFGPRGKIYDGWETRRRRDGADHELADEVIVRLAVPAIVHGIVIDTSFFVGNFPTFASVHGATLLGYPSPSEVRNADFFTLLSKSDLEGDTPNTFEVFTRDRLITHLKLKIYPDGGVARLRVHGEVVADPRLLGGRVDLAATLNGGRITGCSNMFYSSPSNLLAPGISRVMSDGWETARRRNGGNDWVTVALAAPALVHDVVIDTSRFVGNAPGWVALFDADSGTELLPLTQVQPDTVHRFRLASDTEVSHVRLEAHPDGGLSRLHINGTITSAAKAKAGERWLSLLPADLAATISPDDFFS